MAAIPVGNVIEKFMSMPMSFQKGNKHLVRAIYASGNYEEIQRISKELLNKILEAESGYADPYQR